MRSVTRTSTFARHQITYSRIHLACYGLQERITLSKYSTRTLLEKVPVICLTKRQPFQILGLSVPFSGHVYIIVKNHSVHTYTIIVHFQRLKYCYNVQCTFRLSMQFEFPVKNILWSELTHLAVPVCECFLRPVLC